MTFAVKITLCKYETRCYKNKLYLSFFIHFFSLSRLALVVILFIYYNVTCSKRAYRNIAPNGFSPRARAVSDDQTRTAEKTSPIVVGFCARFETTLLSSHTHTRYNNENAVIFGIPTFTPSGFPLSSRKRRVFNILVVVRGSRQCVCVCVFVGVLAVFSLCPSTTDELT